MRKGLPLLCTLLLTGSLTAIAAPVPDAGSILREQQQQAPRLPDTLPKPDEAVVEPSPLTESGVKVSLKGVRFIGITGMASEGELHELLKGAIGKEQGVADLQRLAGLVTEYLRGKGYFLARAYLPKQDVTAGVVEIAVTAGRVDGGANIRVKEPRRIRDSLLRGVVDSGAISGEALQEKALERSLLLLNDLPGISARATLERGQTYGTTRVLVDVAEGGLFSGAISGDNFGNRYTGAFRGIGFAAINDPFGIGDQFTLSLTGAEGLFQGDAAYSAPLHPSGLKGGISYTGLSYEVGKELESLDAHGRADSIGANLSYPLVRSRPFSLWGYLSYEHRQLNDYASGTHISDRSVNAGSAELSARSNDRFGGGGVSGIRLALTTGDLRLGVEDERLADAATAKSAGRYYKFAYSAVRLQRLIGSFTLFASATGQLAGGNLDSSEKYILGGPGGVRSYPVGEASGDEGHSITGELRYDLPTKGSWGSLQLVGFVDAGNITLHKSVWTNAISSATGENNYWLSGGGVGVNLSKASRYAVRGSWAHTIGDNPGRSMSGMDADNRSDDNRFWLQASVWF